MEHEVVKSHHECRCRDCDPITAMAERVDAWKASVALLAERQWPEDDPVTPDTVAGLANWLLYGPRDDD
ncbi:hypothetical protein ACWD2L_06155 [Streptomyces sp. NPDC002754]